MPEIVSDPEECRAAGTQVGKAYAEMELRNSIFFAAFLILMPFGETNANQIGTSTFEKWKSTILDKNKMCINDDDYFATSHLDWKPSHVTLFKLVDCNSNDARWDYQIMPKNISKHLNTSNAFVTIKVPPTGTKHLDQFGTAIKWKNCLKFGYDDPHELTGRLINGKMHGKIKVKFKDRRKIIEGYAKDSVLQPSVERYFTENRDGDYEFLNLTAHTENGEYVIER